MDERKFRLFREDFLSMKNEIQHLVEFSLIITSGSVLYLVLFEDSFCVFASANIYHT